MTSLSWLDDIITAVQARPASKQKKQWIVTDWWTPSGFFHLGNLRSFMTHAVAAQYLNKTRPTKFYYGIEDYDPFDGLPAGVPKDYEKYLGRALCHTPSPDKKFANFAEYAAHDIKQIADYLKVPIQFPKTSEWYHSGKMNRMIKLVIEKADIIRSIYHKIAHKKQPSDWLPVQMICQQCGKIGTTRAYQWDGEKVHYVCEKDWVKYTTGCGYRGANSPFNGNAKLPWKVEWPALWHISQSDLEGSGKEHHTKGGSCDMGRAIIQQVFSAEPPADFIYEFFLLGGQKMSSSAGRGFAATALIKLLPPAIIFDFFTYDNPRRQTNFDLDGETIPHLYDNYDHRTKNYHLRFSKIAYMLQIPNADITIYAKEEKGSGLTTAEKREIEQRIVYAKEWLEKYAPEKYKMTVSQKLPENLNLTIQQQQFLSQLNSIYQKQKKWRGEDLHQKIHQLKTELNLAPREAFSSIYQSFIGKDSGPQVGWLLASLSPEFVGQRLDEAAKKSN